MIKKIPIILIVFRLILAPIILISIYLYRQEARWVAVTLIYLGLLSDIFDGILARHLNVSSQLLRRLDSQVDMIFWFSIGFAAWVLHPNLISENKISIAAILIMEAMCYLISIVKFKRETCTHAFLSKLWGITLLIAFTALIGFNNTGISFALAIIFGLISHVDRILITLILPTWTHDIPSFYHAILIRNGKTFKRYKLFN